MHATPGIASRPDKTAYRTIHPRRIYWLCLLGFIWQVTISTNAVAQSTLDEKAAQPPTVKTSPASAGPITDPWPVSTDSGVPDAVEPPPSPNLPPNAAELASTRATARWAAIIEGKYDDAFKFFSDASQTNYSPADLQRHWSQFSPKSARVHGARCSGEVCTITVFTDSSIKLPRVGLTQQLIPSIERWAWNGASFSLLRK